MAQSSDPIGRESGLPGDPEGQGRSVPGSGKGKARRLLGSLPVIAAALLMLVAAIVALAWYASVWKQEVKVARVVVSGLNLLSRQKLEHSLSAFTGRKLLEVREEELRRALASEPYIKEMKIGRELNGVIRVTVTERLPLATTFFQGQRMIIDTDGLLLPDNAVSARFHRLPFVSGVSGTVTAKPGVWRMPREDARMLEQMISAFSESDYAGLMVREIHLVPANQTWFQASGSPIRFILGNEGNFKEKLKKFEIFWQKVIAKKGLDCYESVDLRFRERVFAREPQIAGSSPVPPEPAPAAPDSLPAIKPVPR
ncbi:MAG: FtsQ-type POTRA domain-containing protein [Chlorobiaceae bacterium]|nr:FtsQ-type POTRA domain-containing protein [Chlorobiaceae bacterium]NTW73357.1 FtsQ-type POTRA domain-containing protein [Chlorobiaceae bacterium]